MIFKKKFSLKNLSRYKARGGWAGLWTDERAFLRAAGEIRKIRGGGEQNIVCLSPYPVHGLEEALEIPRSRIPWAAFAFGLGGCLFGLWFTWWVSAVDWPIIIGGKPHWSLAAFIPVIFELTILFAALSSIAALIYSCGLPHISPPVIDPALTSHKFAIFIPASDGASDGAPDDARPLGERQPEEGGRPEGKTLSGDEAKKLLEDMGAKDILQTVF